jgi:hypothetical protein
MVALGNLAVNKKDGSGEVEHGIVGTGHRIKVIAAGNEMSGGLKSLFAT